MNPEEHSNEVQRLFENEVYSIDDYVSVGNASSPGKNSAGTDSGWMSRRTALDVLLGRYRKKIEMLEARSENRTTFFKPGYMVFTRSSKIADLSVLPVNACKTRIKTLGTVIKESAYFPGFWLVYFFGVQKYYYCNERVVTFMDPSKPSHKLSKSYSNKLLISEVSVNKEDEEFIMTLLLSSKMFKNVPSEGKQLSFEQIATKSKPEYNWINANKLKAFYYKFRNSVDGIIKSDTETLANVQAGIKATWAEQRNIVGVSVGTQTDPLTPNNYVRSTNPKQVTPASNGTHTSSVKLFHDLGRYTISYYNFDFSISNLI